MPTARPFQWVFLPLLLLAWVMEGCAFHQRIVFTPTSTTTNTPTVTPSPTSTPTPSKTATPTFIPTPTSPYPQPHEAINADNISRIQQLALLSAEQDDGVLKVSFSPDGKLVAAGLSYDDTVQLWDVYSGQLLRTLSENFRGTNCDGVKALAFSPDGSQMVTATGCNHWVVRLWDTGSGKSLQVLDDGGGVDAAFSADGRFIAWSNEKVVLWDAVNQQEMRAWKPKSTPRLYKIEFSPDSKLLATFSSAGDDLQLWDVESGKLIDTFGYYANGIRSIAFSANGSLLAINTGHLIQIWELKSHKSMQKIKLADKYEYMLDLAFSPSGEILASVGGVFSNSDPHTKFWQIRFWQTGNGQLLYTQPVSINEWSLAFSPDGRMLLTGNAQHGTLRLWGILP